MAELAAWAAANSAEATAADAIAGGTAADAFCQSIVYGLILSPGGILSLLKLMYSVVFSFAFESSTTEVSGCNKKHLNSAKAKILQWIVEKENKGGIWVAQKEEQTKVQKEEDALPLILPDRSHQAVCLRPHSAAAVLPSTTVLMLLLSLNLLLLALLLH